MYTWFCWPLKSIKWSEHNGGTKSSRGSNSGYPVTAGLQTGEGLKSSLCSTTVFDSTQINTGMWNVKQLSYANSIMVEYYQMKTENQSKSTLQ